MKTATIGNIEFTLLQDRLVESSTVVWLAGQAEEREGGGHEGAQGAEVSDRSEGR